MSTTPCKSLAIITGASRGIGRAIVLALTDAIVKSSGDGGDGDPSPSSSHVLPAPLQLVLVARSGEALRETARLVAQRCGSAGSGGLVRTACHPMDLSNLDTLPNKLQHLLNTVSLDLCDSCWLINNAGSLGPLGQASSIGDMKELRNTIDFNITSACWVSSSFARNFLAAPNSPLIRIVNISSLCAIEPFNNMGTYCAGKAGRELFHSVLAKENKDNGRFKVLNYAPGAADTPMAAELSDFAARGGIKKDAPSADQVGLIRPEDTASKLVNILTKDEYESGSHIDYFDDA
ncbi:hypothetical protein ACHAXT_000455 [Thalassiosira profunda]